MLFKQIVTKLKLLNINNILNQKPMKKLIIQTILLFFVLTAFAQKSEIVGSWLMTKVETNDGVKEPYFITNFKEDGTMFAMGMEVGSWKFDKKANKIVMESTMDKDFSGDNKILKLTKSELTVDKDGVKIYYEKVDTTKLAENNLNSGLFGLWKIQNVNGASTFLKLEAPDNYFFIDVYQGTTERSSGTWIFDPKKNTVIFIGFTHLLRGKNTVKEHTTDKLVMENNGTLITAMRESNDASKIERLTFVYEDFPEEMDENESPLPWIDVEDMATKLKDIHYLTYQRSVLLEEVNSFILSKQLIHIEVDSEKPSVMFTNLMVFNGDTAQYSQNYKGGLSEMYNYFFPKEEPMPYKNKGTESIDVPAGTFECTVIEGLDGDSKVKYWMINDLPGVYAKIITEEIDPFDKLSYWVEELVEIK